MKNILFIIFITGLSSCSRNINCIDPPIYISFVSFPPNSLDGIIIRKFGEGSNFRNPLDTLQVTGNIGSIINRGDTSYLSLGNPYSYPRPGFDWQLFIPSLNRTIFITEINKNDRTGKCSALQTDCFCDDEILNLKVDNQAGVLQTYPTNTLFVR